jgi:hypothetical protein
MVIFDLGETLLKLALRPERATRLGELLISAAARSEKTKENVWVGLW